MLLPIPSNGSQNLSQRLGPVVRHYCCYAAVDPETRSTAVAACCSVLGTSLSLIYESCIVRNQSEDCLQADGAIGIHKKTELQVVYRVVCGWSVTDNRGGPTLGAELALENTTIRGLPPAAEVSELFNIWSCKTLPRSHVSKRSPRLDPCPGQSD